MEFNMVEALADGEIPRALRKLVHELGSQNKAAKVIKTSQPMVGLVLRGEMPPGPKFLDYFGMERKVVYVRKVKPD